MQEFTFSKLDDGACCVMSYTGDEAEVTIPAEYERRPVTVLYDGLFKGHTELACVHIPDSVTALGGFLFDGCDALRSVRLPAQLTDLWQYAFARCGVEELTLPDGVRALLPFTFKDCRRLRRFVCNPSLKKIYAWAFDGCEALTDFVSGPDTELSPQAFETKKP